MAENRRSEGRLVTLEGATAASNIVAGSMVGTSGVTGHLVYTLSSSTVGLGLSGNLGQCFLGVLDEDVSAGDSPITVWTEGVFEFELSTAALSGALYLGAPVWASDSGTVGQEVNIIGETGSHAIGTLVGAPAWATTSVGHVQVKISPAMYHWSYYQPAATATNIANPFQYPPAVF